MTLFPTAYFGNISYYAHYLTADKPVVDIHEHFIKQTYRNRCEILSANGKLALTVPVIKRNHTPVHEVAIDNQQNWAPQHWKSIESAYGRAPFFEFYADELKAVLWEEHLKLIDLNKSIHERFCALTGLENRLNYSSKFVQYESNDLRLSLSPKNSGKKEFPPYLQTFQDKFGFTPNLCWLDLLFNLGPESIFYLQRLDK